MFTVRENAFGNFNPVYKGHIIDGIEGNSKKKVREVAELFVKEIERQIADEDNNYGLLFYSVGYDGKRQQEVSHQVLEVYNVRVF